MSCEICGKDGDMVTLKGYPMHPKCAPAHWPKDEKNRVDFMRQVRDLAGARGDRWRKWK